MKFISKNINLRVVLRHGTPPEPISGRLAVPGLYVKFEDGRATINDEETIRLLLAHPGFNHDFIMAEENQVDPFVSYRREKEPAHQMTELKYGTFGKSTGPRQNKKYTSDQLAMIKEEATRIAKEMLKEVLQTKQVVDEEPKKGGDSTFRCDCGFVAKSKFGLNAHQRACKKTTSK
jgi:hypothetical protein